MKLLLILVQSASDTIKSHSQALKVIRNETQTLKWLSTDIVISTPIWIQCHS